MGNFVAKNKFAKALEDGGEDAFVKAVKEHVSKPEEIEDLKEGNWDFECLVFEGGGVRGFGYGGALMVLDEVGILKNIKRVGGTSAGAYMALQIVLGTDLDQIMVDNLIPDFRQFCDSGPITSLWNAIWTYGWYSGNNLKLRIEDTIENSLGSRRVNFYELYQRTGRELCVVVTDLCSKRVMYCHPKTTPGMDVAEAIRTSMAIPMIYTPRMVEENGMHLFYVDGGLLQIYLIAVFDGWFLSMKPEDSFLERFGDDPRSHFKGTNEKTLGMAVFGAADNLSDKKMLIKRLGDQILQGRPQSPMSNKRQYTRKAVERIGQEDLTIAAYELAKFLVEEIKSAEGPQEGLTLDELEAVVEKMKLDPTLRQYLITMYGSAYRLNQMDEPFKIANINMERKLSMVECLDYLSRRGICLSYNLDYQSPTKITSITDFFLAVTDVMRINHGDLAKPEDQARTIGIYTDYVNSADFNVDFEDKVYLLEQGYRAAVALLREKMIPTKTPTDPSVAE